MCIKKKWVAGVSFLVFLLMSMTTGLVIANADDSSCSVTVHEYDDQPGFCYVLWKYEFSSSGDILLYTTNKEGIVEWINIGFPSSNEEGDIPNHIMNYVASNDINAEVVTDENGYARFYDLESNISTLYVQETAAPDGYVPLFSPLEIETPFKDAQWCDPTIPHAKLSGDSFAIDASPINYDLKTNMPENVNYNNSEFSLLCSLREGLIYKGSTRRVSYYARLVKDDSTGEYRWVGLNNNSGINNLNLEGQTIVQDITGNISLAGVPSIINPDSDTPYYFSNISDNVDFPYYHTYTKYFSESDAHSVALQYSQLTYDIGCSSYNDVCIYRINQETNEREYYKFDFETGTVSWIASALSPEEAKTNGLLTTNSDFEQKTGYSRFMGLTSGEYFVYILPAETLNEHFSAEAYHMEQTSFRIFIDENHGKKLISEGVKYYQAFLSPTHIGSFLRDKFEDDTLREYKIIDKSSVRKGDIVTITLKGNYNRTGSARWINKIFIGDKLEGMELTGEWSLKLHGGKQGRKQEVSSLIRDYSLDNSSGSASGPLRNYLYEMFVDSERFSFEKAKDIILSCTEDPKEGNTSFGICYGLGNNNSSDCSFELTYKAKITDENINLNQNNSLVAYNWRQGTSYSECLFAYQPEMGYYPTDLIVHNIDMTSSSLTGGSFVLYKLNENNNKVYYHLNSDTNEVEWIDISSDSPLNAATNGIITNGTTDESGTVTFPSLEPGTYYVEQTVAPSGYLPIDQDVIAEITVETGSILNVNAINSTGSVLPETGGAGTVLFTMMGLLLMAGAATIYLTHIKRHQS